MDPTRFALLTDSKMISTSRCNKRLSVKNFASSEKGSLDAGSGLPSASNLTPGHCNQLKQNSHSNISIIFHFQKRAA